MERQEKPSKNRKNLDLIILLSILALTIVFSGSAIAATTNQAEGEDVDIYIASGGLAFQDGVNPSCFIALYTPTGALNTSENEFYIGPQGGGMFTFVSNETFGLQFLKSVSANIEGDSGNSVRAISATADGLSDVYNVTAGNTVTITWAPTIDFPYALPIISFWGMIGGGLIGSIFTGAGIKKRNFQILFVGLMAFLATLIFYLIFVNI